jgi:hypothetical protein
VSGDKNIVSLEAADYAAIYIYVIKYLLKHNDKNLITFPTEVNAEEIQPLEIRPFTLPPGTYSVLKLWDHGDFMMIYGWGNFCSITKFFGLQEF